MIMFKLKLLLKMIEKWIRFVITVKKTSDFEKIYNENEEMKKKKDEERKAREEK